MAASDIIRRSNEFVAQGDQSVEKSCKFCLSCIVLLVAWSLRAEELSRAQIAKQIKQATVFVEANRDGAGSGFCIDSSGLFVTNYHVVEHTTDLDTVTLITDAGLPTQISIQARVIRRDKGLDLALLQAESGVVAERRGPFVPLTLGSDDKLIELTELIASGFPFGTALSKPGQYPTASVNIVNVSSLRSDDKHELFRIQLDSNLNPGNSGGPVVDRSGKVVGIVVSGIVGRGINLAIPVRHLRRFLEKPVISLVSPIISPEQKHAPYPFTANVITLGSEPQKMAVELVLSSLGQGERRFVMKREQNQYRVMAIPFAIDKDGWEIPIELKYSNGSVLGKAKEQTIHFGHNACRLSEIRTISLVPTVMAILKSGRKFEGTLDSQSIDLRLSGQTVNFSLNGALEMTNPIQVEQTILKCSVIAREGERQLTAYEEDIYLAGSPQATLKGLCAGKFNRPFHAASPTTYFRAVSSPGDYIGRGLTYAVDGSELKVIYPPNAKWAVGIQAGEWHLTFSAPAGKQFLEGEYADAKRYEFGLHTPGISISCQSRGSNRISGKFVVWEAKFENGVIKKLAIDFIQHSEIVGPPLYGMVRYNSSFQ